MDTREEHLEPVEGPLIRLWYFGPIVLLVAIFAALGGVVSEDRIPMWGRIVSAALVWLGPLTWAMLLRGWMRRLDEFQNTLIMQAMAMTGATTLNLIVFLCFYFMLAGTGTPQSPYILVGEAPALYLLMLTMFIAYSERRAMRRARKAGAIGR